VAVKKNGSMTLTEVAKRLKYSHVRISQIEKVALRKLQKKFLEKSN
jgi:DNA-directed RNA polymerase specialized sigma subunit